MTKQKCYISGAISNDWENYKKNFTGAFRLMESKGFTVLTPLFINAALDYEDYMHIDLAMIDVCDCVYLLKNWTESEGAKREKAYAESKGKQIIYEE